PQRTAAGHPGPAYTSTGAASGRAGRGRGPLPGRWYPRARGLPDRADPARPAWRVQAVGRSRSARKRVDCQTAQPTATARAPGAAQTPTWRPGIRTGAGLPG